MAVISKGVVGLLGEIVSLLHGAVASGLKLVNNLVSSGFKMAFQFNESAMAFSRQAGLTAKQAQAYTEVLTTRAKELGEKYGIAAEEVTKLEKNLAKATGRVIMLSNAQADMQVALNRTVGEETANQFSETMMRTMGAQLTAAQGAVSKAYATAAKRGLDAAGMAAKVAQNLSMANRLNFRNGVDGITKMVALSEKLGFNFKSMEGAAEKFYDLQDAIESSAKLTMLGGAFGALGGNPLDMTYEANYDMEAFTDRFAKMVSGLAQFDDKKLMATSSGLQKNFAREFAKAYGVSMDEVMSAANRQAEIKYKNANLGDQINKYATDENGKVDATRREFLLNRTQVDRDKNGKVILTLNGKSMEHYNTDAGRHELEEMMRMQNMSDEDIVREQAMAVVSIKDTLTGYITSIQGMMAEKITPFLPKIREFLGDIYRMIVPHIGQIADNIKKLLTTLFTPETMTTVKSGIETVAKAVLSIAKWITSDWSKALIALAVTPVLASLAWIANQISMLMGARGAGAGAGAGARGGGLWNTMSSRYAAAKRAGMGSWSARGAALAQGWRTSGLLRAGVAGLAGAGLAYGGSAWRDSANEEGIRRGETDDQIASIGGNALAKAGEFGGIGGAVGSIFGPVGTLVGGIGGAVVGAIYGGFSQWSENDRKQREYQNKINEGVVKALNVDNSKTLKIEGLDGPHDLGVNSLAAGGAESAINKEFRDKFNNMIISGTHPNEMFVNQEQQEKFIKATPVGQKEYIYIPQNQTSTGFGEGKLTVNDINVRIKFDDVRVTGDGTSRNFNVSEFINSREFELAFKEMLSRPDIINAVKREWSSSTNMKPMMDTAYLDGYMSSTPHGKLKNGYGG